MRTQLKRFILDTNNYNYNANNHNYNTDNHNHDANNYNRKLFENFSV